MFENLCVRDLRVYADAIGGNVYHYRDKTGLECDAVVHLRNGSYGLIEIKLGGDQLISQGAENLLRLADRPFAYKRSDGVCVVPVSCLRD